MSPNSIVMDLYLSSDLVSKTTVAVVLHEQRTIVEKLLSKQPPRGDIVRTQHTVSFGGLLCVASTAVVSEFVVVTGLGDLVDCYG